MQLIKRWMSRHGISAQFYYSNGGYYLDYSGCKITVAIPVINGKPSIPSGVPATYKTAIRKYFSAMSMGAGRRR